METQRTVAAYSRYCQHRIIPDPMFCEQSAVQALYSFCEQEAEPPVVFPLSDEWVTALAKHKQWLSKVAILCVADWETVQTVVEKDSFYRQGELRNYSTPQTWRFDEAMALAEPAFPIVAKPRYRRFSFNADKLSLIKALNRLRCVVLADRQAVQAIWDQEVTARDFLLFQEYVPGLSDCMYCIGIYANTASEVLGLFTGHKIRGFPADIGNCVVGENYNLPPELIALVKRIVTELKITGIAEFEFKKAKQGGPYRLIEINLRPWSWIGITPACGVNLPWIAYQDLCGEPVSYVAPQLPNGEVKYIRLLDDAVNCLFRYPGSDPRWHKSFGAWRRDIQAPHRVLAEFSADDRLVGMMAVVGLLGRIVRFGWNKLADRVRR
jgi:predicted ATP-grasp superfamily ATP-dependent carboligase